MSSTTVARVRPPATRGGGPLSAYARFGPASACRSVKPPPRLDEKTSDHSRQNHAAGAVQGSENIGRAIWGKGLQGLQRGREHHEPSPNYERPWPSEAEHQRNNEIADEVIDLPAKP